MPPPNRPYLNTPDTNPEYFRNNNRYPLPPATGTNAYMYPSDLVTGERNFYMQIQFVQYEKRSVFAAPFLSPMGGVTLPIPKRINDQQSVVWQSVEGGPIAAAIEVGRAGANFGSQQAALGGTGTQQAMAAGLGGVLAGGAAGVGSAISNLPGAGLLGSYLGLAPNPFLTMLFKSGDFKEHTFNWTFTPHNQNESRTLVDIIQYFKFNMLPSKTLGILLKYPNIALIRLYPNDFFTYRFKPCAVVACAVDYSGAGQPSFFENGAPTVINFSLQLKEIELWMQEDFGAFI